MARDDDDFRIRPGKVRDRGRVRSPGCRVRTVRTRTTSFVGQVHQAIRRAGGNPNRSGDPGRRKGGGRFNARGRPFARAWTEDLEKVLSVISDALKRLDDLGAYVLPRADAGSIFGAMQESFEHLVPRVGLDDIRFTH